MQEDNYSPALSFLRGLTRATVMFILLLAFLFTISQTSVCPPNLKVVIDFTFESAVKAAEPLKNHFPKPITTQNHITE
ncbi:hypothetical protein Emin_1502 [Elusimicrobium minutum Pei191]|uniref:Uncharacterized protein n=1 Tax=Elusimicrobium minutum (strain Pei191) TaxID=445932 RepID=B2KEV4_ELUMP|nr:hypothetical protein [Elusimicrobium minutum]ACC99050.1 hypothetical protein Emin_1502 [Elusimicrobium minutum Pei191]